MGDYYGSASAGGGASQKSNLDADKIFVGGLSWQTTEESLRYHFEQYGAVVSVELMRDRATGDPRGFAFVVFQDIETVDLVMADPRHEINHKVVDVKRAQARGIAPPSIHNGNKRTDGEGGGEGEGEGASGSPDGRQHHQQQQQQQHQQQQQQGGPTPEQLHNKVFVGGIPPNVDRDELKRIFETYGPVADAIVMMDPVQRRSRGFGFVTFENDTQGAQKAIDAQPIPIQDRQVEVKLATPKGEQQNHPKAAGPKNVGLRAGMGSSSGKYAGLAASFGRNGWKAGYGSKAFGAYGWAVWDDGGKAPDRSGFSFDLLQPNRKESSTTRGEHADMPVAKRTRH